MFVPSVDNKKKTTASPAATAPINASAASPARNLMTPAALRTRLPLLLAHDVLVSLNDPALAARIVEFLIATYPNTERDEPKAKKLKT